MRADYDWAVVLTYTNVMLSGITIKSSLGTMIQGAYTDLDTLIHSKSI